MYNIWCFSKALEDVQLSQATLQDFELWVEHVHQPFSSYKTAIWQLWCWSSSEDRWSTRQHAILSHPHADDVLRSSYLGFWCDRSVCSCKTLKMLAEKSLGSFMSSSRRTNGLTQKLSILPIWKQNLPDFSHCCGLVDCWNLGFLGLFELFVGETWIFWKIHGRNSHDKYLERVFFFFPWVGRVFWLVVLQMFIDSCSSTLAPRGQGVARIQKDSQHAKEGFVWAWKFVPSLLSKGCKKLGTLWTLSAVFFKMFTFGDLKNIWRPVFLRILAHRSGCDTVYKRCFH